MVIPPGAAKLLYPEIFQRRRNLERDDKKEAAEESLAVGAIPPLQIPSELIIKERRGIRTWLLETGTTTGHFLLLTFIRFISGLPKISERRGRRAAARRSPSEAPRPRSEARTRWKRRRESEVFPWHPAVSASRESSEPRSRNQALQA